MPGAPQLITQTIPLTEVLIGVSSNIENADGAFSAQEPPTTGPFYPTGYTVVFNSQIGRFNPSGAGSSVRYELVSITSVEWQFHRLPDNDGAGCGVHITGARTVDVTGTTLSWATSGGAVSHEFLLDLGGGGADIYTRTVGYATRAEVSDGDLTGDGPGLLDDDGVQTVSWTKSPPTAGGETSIIAFGQQFDSGDDRPFVELDQVTITYTRRRLGGGGPYLGMRR